MLRLFYLMRTTARVKIAIIDNTRYIARPFSRDGLNVDDTFKNTHHKFI